MLNIGDYTVKDAEVTVDLLDFSDVTVTICRISAEDLMEIREDCTKGRVFNKGSKEFEEKIDNKKFLRLYADAVITNWSGLKGKHLKKLMLINLPEDMLEEDITCNIDNKTELLSRSTEFDDFVTSILGDVVTFNRQLSESEEAK